MEMNQQVGAFTQGRILIVDDNAVANRALVEILSLEGYSVATACDGFSALTRLAEFAPEIILCDLDLPGMDGITFIREALRRGNSFHLAIMSASHVGQDVAAALGADYVPKPVNLGRLLAWVGEKTRPWAQRAQGT